MDEKRTNSTVRIAAVGAALVAAILILGTIWTGRSARKDTVDAVRSVSMLYMDELAGRRVQVVEDNLNENIRIIRIAVDLINEAEDLRDLEHMRSYQRYMKTLFNLFHLFCSVRKANIAVFYNPALHLGIRSKD